MSAFRPASQNTDELRLLMRLAVIVHLVDERLAHAVQRLDDLGAHVLGPAAVEAADARGCRAPVPRTIRSAFSRPSWRGGEEIGAVVHVVLAHDRHRAPARPASSTGSAPSSPCGRTRCARRGRAPARPLTRASRRARRRGPCARSRRFATIESSMRHAQVRVVGGVLDGAEAVRREDRQGLDAEVRRRQDLLVQALHQPRQHAADRDGVEAHARRRGGPAARRPAGRRCRTAAPSSGTARSPSCTRRASSCRRRRRARRRCAAAWPRSSPR